MTTPVFSITADGRLFYGGAEIGTIQAEPATVNGIRFVTHGRTIQDADGSYLQSYDIAASGNATIAPADGTFVNEINPEAVTAARAARDAAVERFLAERDSTSRCLMDDGSHARAALGHDLCAPCEAHMAEPVL